MTLRICARLEDHVPKRVRVDKDAAVEDFADGLKRDVVARCMILLNFAQIRFPPSCVVVEAFVLRSPVTARSSCGPPRAYLICLAAQVVGNCIANFAFRPLSTATVVPNEVSHGVELAISYLVLDQLSVCHKENEPYQCPSQQE